MLKVQNKKIAIIGSSPIMMIIAKILSQKNIVTVYEKKNLGGAWTYNDMKELNTNLFTNVLVPSNRIVEKNLYNLNNFLKKFNVKIEYNQKSYRSISRFKPKHIYKYDFSTFFKDILKNNKIDFKKIDVKILNEKNDYILLNNKYKYDEVFIPFFNSLKKIIYLNKKIQTPFKTIISKHAIFITKTPLIKNLYYSEQGHNFFDRMQIKKIKKFYIFSARISKKFKKKSKSFFIKNFSLLNDVNLYYSKINTYTNYYRNEQQIKNLTKIASNRIKIINTAQLYESISSYFLKN